MLQEPTTEKKCKSSNDNETVSSSPKEGQDYIQMFKNQLLSTRNSSNSHLRKPQKPPLQTSSTQTTINQKSKKYLLKRIHREIKGSSNVF